MKLEGPTQCTTETNFIYEKISRDRKPERYFRGTLLKKAKLVREISDKKNEIPHKFFSRKI